MAELKGAGIELVVVVGDDDSAAYAYGLLSPAMDPVVVIAPEAFDAYQIAGVPTNLLVGPDGKAALGQVGWSERLFTIWLDAAKTAKDGK